MLTWAERPGTLSPLSIISGPACQYIHEGLMRGRLPTG